MMAVLRFIGFNGTSCIDSTGIINGQIYYYSIFALDTNLNFSTGLGVSAIPSGLYKSPATVSKPNTAIEKWEKYLPAASAGFSGWNDLMGDFVNPNTEQFWSKEEITSGSGNSKLTLKKYNSTWDLESCH